MPGQKILISFDICRARFISCAEAITPESLAWHASLINNLTWSLTSLLIPICSRSFLFHEVKILTAKNSKPEPLAAFLAASSISRDPKECIVKYFIDLSSEMTLIVLAT